MTVSHAVRFITDMSADSSLSILMYSLLSLSTSRLLTIQFILRTCLYCACVTYTSECKICAHDFIYVSVIVVCMVVSMHVSAVLCVCLYIFVTVM
jgi:hypothetical protein